MIPPRPRAVVFDWDGTLMDNAEPTFRCYVRTFADFGIAYDRAAYEETYSPNWYHTFRCVGIPEERWPEADAKWLTYFAEESTLLLPGAHEALELLGAHGIARGIVTSGGRERVGRELVLHG